jgi:hypothetical protein
MDGRRAVSLIFENAILMASAALRGGGVPLQTWTPMKRSTLARACLVTGMATLSLQSTSVAGDDFKPIFNGENLSNWEGDRRYWSVSGGVIRGETSLARMATSNTFLIWRGGLVKDFDLRLKVRIRNGNSGVQYRSQDLGKHVVAGYQAEVDNSPGKAGFLYQEKGRKFLALVGEKVEIDEAQKPKVIGQLADKKELIAQRYYREKEWNEYRILARGNRLAHYLNGVQVVDVLDNDPKGRSLEGILALQIHCGPPMLVEFKDILLKSL